ncbi:hypothetical protein E2C01_066547 [Portunus trituberculatus]|uniref:Uncharacterized protein n=1 Tax=Portunus trituberculatus TaxID=210409 RepID=A0A5B7HIG3_PORTR|nr:hypothetical protein [Portunus trituberculatus]
MKLYARRWWESPVFQSVRRQRAARTCYVSRPSRHSAARPTLRGTAAARH